MIINKEALRDFISDYETGLHENFIEENKGKWESGNWVEKVENENVAYEMVVREFCEYYFNLWESFCEREYKRTMLEMTYGVV